MPSTGQGRATLSYSNNILTMYFHMVDWKRRVTELRPKDTEEEPYYYTFKVQCSSCREMHPNWVSFTRFVRLFFFFITQPHPQMNDILIRCEQEKHDIPGSRGEANFVWKCKLCGVSLSRFSSLPTVRPVCSQLCLSQMVLSFVSSFIATVNLELQPNLVNYYCAPSDLVHDSKHILPQSPQDRLPIN